MELNDTCQRLLIGSCMQNKNCVDAVMIARVLARTNCPSYRPCILLALSFASFTVCAWPQTQLATVFGTVNDPSGAVIPAAQVTIVNQSTGLKRSTLTDMAGQYRLAGLPTGTYVLRTEKERFQNQAREGIALTAGSEI